MSTSSENKEVITRAAGLNEAATESARLIDLNRNALSSRTANPKKLATEVESASLNYNNSILSPEKDLQKSLQNAIDDITGKGDPEAYTLIGLFYCILSEEDKYRNKAREYFEIADEQNNFLCDEFLKTPIENWSLRFSPNDELMKFAHSNFRNPLVSFFLSQLYNFERLSHHDDHINYNRRAFYLGISYGQGFPFAVLAESCIIDEDERYRKLIELADAGDREVLRKKSS